MISLIRNSLQQASLISDRYHNGVGRFEILGANARGVGVGGVGGG